MKNVTAWLAVCVCLLAVGMVMVKKTLLNDDTVEFSMTPWASVGGCGAGGSGGGSADGIKWVGLGASGGLIDVEIMPKYNFGQNFSTLTIAPRFSFKPSIILPFVNYSSSMGVSFPITSKHGEVQYRTNQAANDRTTGGLGDISIDYSRGVGMFPNFSLTLNASVAIPTGQYDIKRGPDAATKFLSSSLQKGGGIWSGTVGFGISKDLEDAMLMMDLSYSHPFNMKLVSGQNEMMDEYFPAYQDSTDNNRFFYRFKPYGENDLGSYSPPSLSGSVTYGYRGVEHYVHSWTLAFGAPLGVAWISNENTDRYDPRPDPDHQAWSGALAYGIEFSKHKYPMYVAMSIPIHDKKNDPNPSDEYNPEPFKKWDAPDMSDFLQQFTFAVGIKSTMF